MRINLDSKNLSSDFSPEHHYKLLLFIGLFFLVASLLSLWHEPSKKVPRFDDLFITEGILKRSFNHLGGRVRHRTIVIQSADGRMLWLSIYRDNCYIRPIKLKDKKLKVWWYSENTNPYNNPHKKSRLYQAEVDGKIIIKYGEVKDLIEKDSIYGSFLLAFVSAIFLFLSLAGYLNKIDGKKLHKL